MNDRILDYQLVRVLQGRVAERLTISRQQREANGEKPLTTLDERQEALSVTQRVVAEHMRSLARAGKELPDGSYDMQLVMAIDAAIYGAGELQELLDDPDIENVDINGCDRVWITYADARGKVLGRPVAASDEDLERIVQNLAAYAGLNARPWTRAHPVLDLRLPDGSRLSATMSASARPSVSIRRNRHPNMTLDQLIELGTIDQSVATFLSAAVRARMNIMVGGATDAGKTTLLRALINEINATERLIVVEKALELGVGHAGKHADVVELEEVLPDPEGRGGLTIDDLVSRSRRHNPSRVIVGEVMGPEVIAMLSAMSQGNNGSLSTIHARDAAGVIQKVATYAMQHNNLSFTVTSALLSEALDFIVFIRKNPLLGGTRTVTEILEVGHFANGGVSMSRVYEPSRMDGRAIRSQAVPFMRYDDLTAAGFLDTLG